MFKPDTELPMIRENTYNPADLSNGKGQIVNVTTNEEWAIFVDIVHWIAEELKLATAENKFHTATMGGFNVPGAIPFDETHVRIHYSTSDGLTGTLDYTAQLIRYSPHVAVGDGQVQLGLPPAYVPYPGFEERHQTHDPIGPPVTSMGKSSYPDGKGETYRYYLYVPFPDGRPQPDLYSVAVDSYVQEYAKTTVANPGSASLGFGNIMSGTASTQAYVAAWDRRR
jgi:hypothetical protein